MAAREFLGVSSGKRFFEYCASLVESRLIHFLLGHCSPVMLVGLIQEPFHDDVI
jgi:hypothetical protein